MVTFEILLQFTAIMLQNTAIIISIVALVYKMTKKK